MGLCHHVNAIDSRNCRANTRTRPLSDCPNAPTNRRRPSHHLHTLETTTARPARRRRLLEEHKEDSSSDSEIERDTRARVRRGTVARSPWASSAARARAQSRASGSNAVEASMPTVVAPTPSRGSNESVDCLRSVAVSSVVRGGGGNGVPKEEDNRVPRMFDDISYLRVGQVFTGTQTVNVSNSKTCDEWRVNVEVQGTDFKRGTICGSMEALDVPKAASPVLTFWRGEIIDNINYFFRTDNWKAAFANDIEHWTKFRAFDELSAAVKTDHGDDIDLSQRRHIFMRWKEIFFVSPENECNLTIAGFYYCCMDRHTGSIAGYYFDPNNSPWQKLLLRAQSGVNGFASADYEFR